MPELPAPSAAEHRAHNGSGCAGQREMSSCESREERNGVAWQEHGAAAGDRHALRPFSCMSCAPRAEHASMMPFRGPERLARDANRYGAPCAELQYPSFDPPAPLGPRGMASGAGVDNRAPAVDADLVPWAPMVEKPRWLPLAAGTIFPKPRRESACRALVLAVDIFLL